MLFSRARLHLVVSGTVVLTGAVGVLLGGCAPDPNDVMAGRETVPPVITNAPDVERTGTVVPVLATDNNFRARETTAKVGDTVQFKNGGRNDHDVVPLEGHEWGVAPIAFGPGAVYEYVFSEPGEYAYYCTIHGTKTAGMVGTIIVTE